MSEDFLYFLWQFQYFRQPHLRTVDGEPLRVIHPGFRNHDAGPDFTNARLVVGDVEWSGTVEAHVRASDWLAHRHQFDRAYDNVILHIVWEKEPRQLARSDGSVIPTLCLSDWADANLLHRYQTLSGPSAAVPCASQLAGVDPLRRLATLDKALLQRLERKATEVMALFTNTSLDWEETTYRLLAAAFGFGINNDPFAQLSRLIPLRILQKHRNSSLQVEALLFGAAGLLNSDQPDDYELALQREYRFLAAKYVLADQHMPAHSWKWAKLRPANFPTLRLAQLAAVLTSTRSLFSMAMDIEDARVTLKQLQVTPSLYWQTHYRFGKSSDKVLCTLGETAASALLINAIVPLLMAYSHHRDLPIYRDRAMTLLEALPAEDNRVTKLWRQLGMPIRSAFDSQASIELYKNFCQPKRCLSCSIGHALLK